MLDLSFNKKTQKMNKSIIKSLFIGTALLLSACTSNFTDINTEPYTVGDDDIKKDLYNTRSTLLGLQGSVISNDANRNQFIECLLGGSFGGYLADSNDGFKQKFSTYNPEEHWIQVTFNDVLTTVFQNYDNLKKYTQDEALLGVGKVIKVLSLSKVTDTYGPIPYTQTGVDGKITAPYDSQELVYHTMLQELDEAIAALTERRMDKFSPLADHIYNGDFEKWAKLANSIKLRLAMRIVYVDPQLAQTKAEEAINSEVGVITDNTDNAYFISQNNPFRVVMYEYNGGDSRISADITSYMNGYKDPRREAYFTTSTFNIENGEAEFNGYYGLRNGVLVPKGEYRSYSNMNVESNSKLLWMNAAEIYFLRAEGALRGWNMQGSAEELYNQGIRMSFDQLSVGNVENYIADNKSLPSIYKDPQGYFSFAGNTSNITIKWNNSADFETNLERIITQKWIAIFPLGHEAWSEFRRTGYPKLMPVINNLSPNHIVKDNDMARRLVYPQSEYTNNKENLNNALKNLLNGPDNMATKLWWDKKNSTK